MDGTLLRRDGTIDPADLAALARARAEGVRVTLATGRLRGGTLPLARALDLDVPLVCADGALIASPRTGEVIEATAIEVARAEALIATLVAHAVTPFVFAPDAIHGDAPRGARHDRLQGWTPTVTLHPRLVDATAWREEPVVLTVGLGERARVESAAEIVRGDHGASLFCDSFPFGDEWALRVQRDGCSKGVALAQVAARLGIPREDVAAVGDWVNDVEMLTWAGRSFAMPHAPDSVKSAASDVLAHGGVAVAIARWLHW